MFADGVTSTSKAIFMVLTPNTGLQMSNEGFFYDTWTNQTELVEMLRLGR